jgi:hypothetical protein
MQPEPEPELDFVARITAALAGGERQRETAYAELTTKVKFTGLTQNSQVDPAV